MGDDSTRLNKYLALHTGISRREADELIAKGMVLINGEPAALGVHVHATDHVSVRGKRVEPAETIVHAIIFNKPTGYICSRKRQGDTPTIYDLLPAKYRALKPVGRLDRDSSGLLMLTNDGQFAHTMTHPQFAKTKVYEVTLDHELQPLHQQMIADYGVTLADGTSQLGLTRLSESDRLHWHVTMSEGRNRQIRRTFAALGYTVIGLHRTQFGNYSLGDISPGEWRDAVIS